MVSALLTLGADNWRDCERAIMPTELSSVAGLRTGVTAAIKQASASTGAQFEYLLNTARRESSLDPSAKARTSSAAGLFQFIEQTWLGAVKSHGAKHGLGDLAGEIKTGADGRLNVVNETRRQAILDLRFDPQKAAALAGEMTQDNKAFLERKLGRAATVGDLYAAHFLGPAGAVKMLSAATNAKAADLLPAAAKANPHVFYENGAARSVGDVVASFVQSMSGGRNPQNIASSVDAPDVNREKLNIQYTEHKNVNKTRPNAQAMWAPGPPAKLSSLALSVLYALDPVRLISRGDKSDQN